MPSGDPSVFDVNPDRSYFGETAWKPIATAPKDGTLILIRERCGRVQVAKWCCPYGDRFDWYVQLTQSGDDGYPTWDVVQWSPIPK